MSHWKSWHDRKTCFVWIKREICRGWIRIEAKRVSFFHDRCFKIAQSDEHISHLKCGAAQMKKKNKNRFFLSGWITKMSQVGMKLTSARLECARVGWRGCFFGGCRCLKHGWGWRRRRGVSRCVCLRWLTSQTPTHFHLVCVRGENRLPSASSSSPLLCAICPPIPLLPVTSRSSSHPLVFFPPPWRAADKQFKTARQWSGVIIRNLPENICSFPKSAALRGRDLTRDFSRAPCTCWHFWRTRARPFFVLLLLRMSERSPWRSFHNNCPSTFTQRHLRWLQDVIKIASSWKVIFIRLSEMIPPQHTHTHIWGGKQVCVNTRAVFDQNDLDRRDPPTALNKSH